MRASGEADSLLALALGGDAATIGRGAICQAVANDWGQQKGTVGKGARRIDWADSWWTR